MRFDSGAGTTQFLATRFVLENIAYSHAAMSDDRHALYSTTLYLVGETKDHNEDAAAKLVERINPWLEKMFMGAHLPRGIAMDDLFQDVWAEVFKGFERFQLEPESSFRGWVLCIANNLVKQHWRRVRTQKRGGGNKEELLLDIAPELTFEGIVDEREARQSNYARCNEIREAMAGVMKQLRERYRQVLELRDEDALTFTEVAERMGFSRERSVRGLYFRARVERARLLARFG